MMNRLDAVAAWPFLVGEAPNIHALAERVGFQYNYDARTDQFAHPAAIVVLTPDGRVSRYLYGTNYRPFDLRLALDEAAQGKIGGIVDRVLLTCFRYDPATRRYAWVVRGSFRGLAVVTLLALLAGMAYLRRRNR
jgi:protein SCO1/2